MASPIEQTFELDRRWHWLRGEMEESKKPALYRLAKLLTEQHVPYAIIGGIALQLRQAEPRTTLDIDVAVKSRGVIPRGALESCGFSFVGDFPYAQNWMGPGGVPVQFSDEPALHSAIDRADAIAIDDLELRVVRSADLLHAKLRAAADAARRRSKRVQDLADAISLLEQDPRLDSELTTEERRLIEAAGPA